MTPDDRYGVCFDGQVVEVVWRVAPDAGAVREVLARVREDVAPRPGTAILFVDRGPSFDPAPAELHAIIQTLAGFMPGFDRHVAVVVEAERHEEMWRRCSAGCTLQGIHLRPFRERQSARDWLAERAPAGRDSR